MKQIDFDHGTVTGNILGAALPMLVAQILSLLYNIVDRIYIARIPSVGTTALGAVGLCFPIIVIITAFSNLFGSGGAPIFSINRGKGNDHEYIIFNAVYLWSGIDGDRNAVRKSDSGVVRGVGRRAVLHISIHDDLFDRNSPIYDCNRDEPIY